MQAILSKFKSKQFYGHFFLQKATNRDKLQLHLMLVVVVVMITTTIAMLIERLAVAAEMEAQEIVLVIFENIHQISPWIILAGLCIGSYFPFFFFSFYFKSPPPIFGFNDKVNDDQLLKMGFILFIFFLNF